MKNSCETDLMQYLIAWIGKVLSKTYEIGMRISSDLNLETNERPTKEALVFGEDQASAVLAYWWPRLYCNHNQCDV